MQNRSIQYFLAERPHDFAKSKSRRRFDVSQNSHRAQSVVKMSPSVVRMSWSVDFVSHSVDFRSVFAPSASRMTLGATPFMSSRYGKRIGELQSKQRLLGPQKPEKHPKNRFWNVRNSDLRRFWRSRGVAENHGGAIRGGHEQFAGAERDGVRAGVDVRTFGFDAADLVAGFATVGGHGAGNIGR